MNPIEFEVNLIYGIAKIAAIVYMVMHLLVILIITRQAMLAARVIKTELRTPIFMFALSYAVVLFVILLITVFVNPLP